ncbi:MAG: carboxypeptidase regulatory-like domain-containing protein [Acidobacteria bacterium]|nr:carboxypeptidase regulatory-like domain-containing protein [Acidobacteriota bacterium]
MKDAAVRIRRSEGQTIDPNLAGPDAADLEAESGLIEWKACLPGAYDLAITAAGHFRRVLRDVVVLPGSPTDLSDVHLEPGGMLAGRIVDDASGLPIDRASIKECGESCDVDGPTLARSGEDGRFDAEGLPPGAVRLLIVKTGYADGSLELSSAPSERPSESEVRLGRGGTIQGTVVDAEGAHQHGVSLTVADALRSRNAVTDAAGRYLLTDVTPGRRMLSKYVPGTGPEGFDRRSVDVVASAIVRQDFGSGTTLSGVIRRGGQPFAGAVVLAYPADAARASSVDDVEMRSGRTGNDGGYRLTGLGAGKHWISIEQDGARLVRGFEIPQDGTDVVLDLDFPPGHVTGIVLDDETGLPLPGVRVVSSSADSQQSGDNLSFFGLSLGGGEAAVSGDFRESYSVVTSDGGRFDAPLLSRGDTAITFEKQEYDRETRRFGNRPDGDIEIRLRHDVNPNLNLRVRVRDRHGEPVTKGDVQVIVSFAKGREGAIHAALGDGGVTPAFCLNPATKGVIGIMAPGLAPLPFEELRLDKGVADLVKTYILDEGGTLEISLPKEAAPPHVPPLCLRIFGAARRDILPLIDPTHIDRGEGSGERYRVRHVPLGTYSVECGPVRRSVTLVEGGFAAADLRSER